MAISRFDYVPSQHSINTYVPLPFQEMALAGASLQKDQDKAEEDIQNASKVFKVPNLPFEAHAQTARAKETEYQSALKNTADKLASGVIKPFEAEQEAGSLLQKFQSDPIVRGLTQDVAQRTQQEKHLEGQKEKADKELYDQSYGQFQKEFTTDPNKRYIAPLYSRQKEDVIKGKFEPAIDDLMDSFVEKGNLHKVQDRYGDFHYTLSKKGGINEADIRSHLLPSVTGMLKSQEGEYWLDRFYNQPNLKYENLTKEQQKTAKEAFGEELVNRAKAKLHSEISNTEKYDYAPEYVTKEEKENYVPYYQTPAMNVPGQNLNLDYLSPKTRRTPYTEKEQQDILKSAKTGEEIRAAQSTISLGKLNKDIGEYHKINELPEKEKKYVENYAKNFFPNVYDRDKEGKATKEEYKSLYENAQKAAELANQDILSGTYVRQFTPEEKKIEAIPLFGSENNTVKELGTGVGANVKYYFPDTGETLTYDKIKDEFDENSRVEVAGFVDPKNPLPVLTGDKSFRNPKQLTIEGRVVYMSGPKGYVSPKSGARTQEDINNVVNNTRSDIYQARYNPNSPTIVKPYGIDKKEDEILVTFIPSKEDPNTGIFKANVHGQILSSQDSDLLEDEIRNIIANK